MKDAWVRGGGEGVDGCGAGDVDVFVVADGAVVADCFFPWGVRCVVLFGRALRGRDRFGRHN